MGVSKRLKISSLNTHLLCPLCQGYYVEATAIVECLHTFCRSCIVKYLRTNNFCPICDVQIQKSKPWSSLRTDKILQDLVYKLVPGLYQNEMRRRRQFYSRLGGDADVGEGEERGYLPDGARFFSQDDSISLSLEYYSGQDEKEEEEEKEKVERDKEKENSPVNHTFKHSKEKPKRYLQCPAAVTVRHLKKFLRMKYGIGLDCWVDIIYNDECLPEDFSLIDVAYTFTWKRTSPMRFSYQIFSKMATKAIKSQKSFQKFRADEREENKSKQQSNLEQQMQSEYLGNFNLNPTNAGLRKTQNCRNKSNFNNSNKRNSMSASNGPVLKKCKKDEFMFKDSQESDEGSREQTINISEDSSMSTRLRIFSEKEESCKENSEDSLEITLSEIKKQSSVTNFAEEAVDSFTASKLLKSKRKAEGKKEKRRFELARGKKRRKSAGHVEEYVQIKRRHMVAKRRKTIADEFSLKREAEERVLKNYQDFADEEEVQSDGKLKNEALRKVFVTKEKPEVVMKRTNFEVRKKKRKKSKHHEGDAKKRKLGLISTSPSIMSIAKDALKLKVKLTPNKPIIKSLFEENKKLSNAEIEEVDLEKSNKNLDDNDNKKMVTDKERLSHLRAVRHKNIVNKNGSKNYINAPPSLIISKIDSSEPHPVKTNVVDSRPSLEIKLVNPSDNSKAKTIEINPEPQKEKNSNKVESPVKEVQKSEVVDNFGVLDLSEKSTRTKQSGTNLSPLKEATEPIEKSRKSNHQSILQIAQTLVNRKMSPILSDSFRGNGFDSSADSSATVTAMRNLQTLSDTAVNILMAAQSKTFAAETQKHPFVPPVSPPAHKLYQQPLPNSTKPLKDCENGSSLKIPLYLLPSKRTTPIPPVPNLHEIYPRGKGRSPNLAKPSTPAIKPGQNQTVRQIPNPFAVLNRQANQNAINALPSGIKSPTVSENGEETTAKSKYSAIPPLQSIKAKQTIPKLDDLAEFSSSKNFSNDLKTIVPKIVNNNTKSVQNGSESTFFGMKNREEKKTNFKFNNNSSSIRKIENMAKNIESVAAGLTARAVSNSIIDAK